MCFPSKLQIWLNIVVFFFFFLFPFLFSFALKLGQADPSHGNSFQTELPKRLLCHKCSQYRCHAQKLIEKRLTCFKACWELGARRKPKVLKLRQSPVCYKKATYAHKSNSAPISPCCDYENIFYYFLLYFYFVKISVLFGWIKGKTYTYSSIIFFFNFENTEITSYKTE